MQEESNATTTTPTAVFEWLAERVRDLALWPINLVRDFPARSGRLLRTLWRGGRGLVFFGPELWRAGRAGAARPWLRRQVGRSAAWLHRLLAELFDLVGGPELAQFLMHLITRTTPLTADEVAMIGHVLGPRALRFGDVRVAEGGLLDLVFQLNGNLAFATWHTVYLPRRGAHGRANRAIVVHELTHVYQYERVGSRYLGEAIYMLIKTKRDCYSYGGAVGLVEACTAGTQMAHFNREQQARITQDYYDRLEQGLDVTAYEPFLRQLRAGEI